MAAPASLYADRRNGRHYTAADRRGSGQTSTHGGLTFGHLFANPFFHHLDGHDRCSAIYPLASTITDVCHLTMTEVVRTCNELPPARNDELLKSGHRAFICCQSRSDIRRRT